MGEILDKSKSLLVLIDGNALVHRAYHAYPPSLKVSSTGQQVNAVYGFSSLLLDTLKKFEPEYIVCTFDTSKPTVRHEQYVGYKSNRGEMEPELREQFPLVYDVVEAFNIPIFRVEGFEADDIIGTLVRSKEANSGTQKLIVTGDKDLLQLVNEDTFAYIAGSAFSKSKLYSSEEVKKKFGFGPEYVVDYKSLRGDPSDNIPGVKGIGDKGAKKLIKEFGHLDEIYNNIEDVDKRLRKKLVEYHEEAQLSKTLATIITDVPISFDLSDAKLAEYDKSKLETLFKKFEFRSLIRKLPESSYEDNSSSQVTMFNSVKNTTDGQLQKNYKQIKTLRELRLELDIYSKESRIAFDTETDGLDAIEANIIGISFSSNEGKAFSIFLDDLDGDPKKILSEFFINNSRKLIAHNAKFDLHMLRNFGIEISNDIDDTLIMAYILSNGVGKLGLKELAFNKLGMVMDAYEDVFGKGNAQLELKVVDKDKMSNYACADADATLRLFNFFTSEFKLTGNKKLLNLYENIEKPVINILLEMEREGVVLDDNYLNNFKKELEQEIDELTQGIYKIVGHEFNINSPKQVGEVLFKELELPGGKKTKSGSFQTNEKVLRDIRELNPIVNNILDYREISKLKSTYTDALVAKKSKTTDRVHTSYNQAVAATGRLTSSDPNLQNIPISSQKGLKIRKAFKSSDGFKLLALDIAQQELRVAANLSGEDNLIKAFLDNIDVHALTASNIFEIDISDVDKEKRRVGKTLNFSLLYGISSFGLADRLKIDRNDAQDMIDKFWQGYPNIKQYFDKIITDAKSNGYAETYYGRRRDASGLRSSNFRIRSATEREIINFPIQGTSADLMKMAMIKVKQYLSGLNHNYIRLLLQVHDEIILEYNEEKIDLSKVSDDLKSEMESVSEFKVPLIVEPKIGYDWASLKNL